ncbi:MAG: hypothetical protein ACKOES_07995 [Planctomycetaceae bacterium]
MNKAFCREPDETRPARCPACGNKGLVVSADTLAEHVTAAAPGQLGEPVAFCGTDTCDVAYFDLLERVVPVAEARGLPWPKDPGGTLCACFGLTADDVDADIVAGSVERVRDVVRRAGQPGAECGLRAADGRSCTARVQRYFLRRRAELIG